MCFIFVIIKKIGVRVFKKVAIEVKNYFFSDFLSFLSEIRLFPCKYAVPKEKISRAFLIHGLTNDNIPKTVAKYEQNIANLSGFILVFIFVTTT